MLVVSIRSGDFAVVTLPGDEVFRSGVVLVHASAVGWGGSKWGTLLRSCACACVFGVEHVRVLDVVWGPR